MPAAPAPHRVDQLGKQLVIADAILAHKMIAKKPGISYLTVPGGYTILSLNMLLAQCKNKALRELRRAFLN
jgi:hypothetical protein